MSPSLARIFYALLIVGLIVLERDKNSKESPAVWIAVVWIFLGASRMVSQWMGAGISLDNPDQYLDGSPLDRNILIGILVAGLIVLAMRGARTGAFLRANPPVVLFFAYCLLSCLWSDFPLVALKRWTKALGNLTMVLVVLTDPDPVAAVRRLFARIGFLLIPISLLLIKYYPDLGRGYISWEWTTFYVGASTDKNGLGALLMVFGSASLWRFIELVRAKGEPNRTGPLVAHGILLVMTFTLFKLADSSTAFSCFLLAGLLMIVTSRTKTQQPANLHAIMASMIGLAALGYIFSDVYVYVVHSLGRNTTLTGRTDIWADLFQMDFNQWLGTGFESFWLGPRAEYFWNKYIFHPNQAHNGYIETYINLGWVGVGLLIFMMVSGYRNIVAAYRENPRAGNLRIAILVVAIIYNMTEAAFKVMHPVWIAFLVAIIAVPPAPDVEHESEKATEPPAKAKAVVGAATRLPAPRSGPPLPRADKPYRPAPVGARRVPAGVRLRPTTGR
jgi:exopolysaccharide production protein ExoQ